MQKKTVQFPGSEMEYTGSRYCIRFYENQPKRCINLTSKKFRNQQEHRRKLVKTSGEIVEFDRHKNEVTPYNTIR